MNHLSEKINYVRRVGFSNVFDGLITLSFIFCIGFLLKNLLQWLFFRANWTVVTHNLSLYTFGIFPPDQRWRPTLWLFSLLALTTVTLLRPGLPWVRKLIPIAWISAVPVGIYLLSGGLGLLPISSRYWGGLTLTLFFDGI